MTKHKYSSIQLSFSQENIGGASAAWHNPDTEYTMVRIYGDAAWGNSEDAQIDQHEKSVTLLALLTRAIQMILCPLNWGKGEEKEEEEENASFRVTDVSTDIIASLYNTLSSSHIDKHTQTNTNTNTNINDPDPHHSIIFIFSNFMCKPIATGHN